VAFIKLSSRHKETSPRNAVLQDPVSSIRNAGAVDRIHRVD